jgi:multicomponent Na+:H+ antiporter subunit F
MSFCMVAALLPTAARWALPVLLVAILMAFFRLIRGPNAADRVLAVDVMATLSAGAIGLYAIAESQPTYIDVAIVVILVTFLATIGFARYLAGQQAGKE